MKIKFLQKRKLRAATARRMPQAAMEGYAQEPEMSFAKAIIVILVLHIVAVGGIYAFSSLKARNNLVAQNSPQHAVKDAAADPAETNDTVAAITAVKPAAADAQPVDPAHNKMPDQTVKPVKETTAPAKDPIAFYTVAKGDNPVAIARKLHVSYDELLKLNKITDPKKLQIGQKLRIPPKKNT